MTEATVSESTPDPQTQSMPDRAPLMLAGAGFVVLGIGYFSHTPAPGPNPDDFGSAPEDAYAKAIPVWLQTIADGVSFLRQQPRVAGDHIGLIGWSLGAYVALLSAASTQSYRAVVSISGFVSGHGTTKESFQSKALSFPPTLVLQGDADNVVTVQNAYDIQSALQADGRQCQLTIFPGGDHYWKGKQGNDGYSAMLTFLRAHLK